MEMIEEQVAATMKGGTSMTQQLTREDLHRMSGAKPRSISPSISPLTMSTNDATTEKDGAFGTSDRSPTTKLTFSRRTRLALDLTAISVGASQRGDRTSGGRCLRTSSLESAKAVFARFESEGFPNG